MIKKPLLPKQRPFSFNLLLTLTFDEKVIFSTYHSLPVVAEAIKDSNLPEEVRVGAIVRKNKVMMPKSNFIFEKEDIVVILSKREQLKEVEDIFRITS